MLQVAHRSHKCVSSFHIWSVANTFGLLADGHWGKKEVEAVPENRIPLCRAAMKGNLTYFRDQNVLW